MEVVATVKHFSKWMSERAWRITQLNGISGKEMFAIKMHLNLNPISVLITFFLCALFSFSTLFYLSEVGIRNGEYNRFEKYGNAVWVAA